MKSFIIFGLFLVIFLILFINVFIFIFGSLICSAIKQAKSPELTVDAVVVDKYIRTSTNRHSRHYIVFDVLTPRGAIDTSIGDNGRVALDVGHEQFSLILLQNRGRLTFKGARFICFEHYQY